MAIHAQGSRCRELSTFEVVLLTGPLSRFYIANQFLKMHSKIVFISCLLCEFAVCKTTYDQSQTGDLNVQVDLKDVQIIALLNGGKEEYEDIEYAYDYSEMTIRPQNGTTPKPLNVTTVADVLKDNATISTTINIESTTEKLNSTLDGIETTTTTQSPVTTESNITAISEVEATTKTTYSSEVNVTPMSTSLNSTNCKKGFVLNHKGGCEFKLQGASNALLKIVKLSQKLKLRREHRRDKNETV
ncbi:uncharacterized protein LOC113517382 [Galleria mellonella]|uniref:Uncharacterized protein LOC113517382 n=1 Tax=Galleria mellonella TaxID=7137 RepID=A0A6J1WQV6_GALME|nr:uncharacterized protein LOC113517382 [Galleria mellonella]